MAGRRYLERVTIAAPATDPGYVAFDGVAVQPDGTAVVAVRTSTGPRLYRKPLGGVVAAPIAVVPADSYFFDLQTDAAGNVHLAQGGDLSGIYLTRTRTLSPTGVLSAPIDVRPPSPDLYLAELVVAPDGTEHARLTDPAGGASYVALRPAGAGAFQAIQQVSGPDTGQTDMTVTPTGDSLVLWGRNVSPTDNRVMVGGIDSGVPPSLTDLAIPTATVAGTPVRLSVKAADHMGLSSVNWQFGDGTSGNGEAVTHAWGSPGTRTVTVTATDRAGNSASAQGTVTVVTPASSRPPRLRVALRAPRRISFARLRARGVRVVARVSKAARPATTTPPIRSPAPHSKLNRRGPNSAGQDSSQPSSPT